VSPLSEESIRLLLQKYSIKPSKKRGQNFLIDQQIARQIVSAADLTKEDAVLEIGGGLGILTRFLASQAGKVHVIELDPGLVCALNDLLYENGNVSVIQGDALKEDLPTVNKVVSNLPYSISSPITFRLLTEVKPELSVLMYQKELVDRMFAEPGSSDYSRFSVSIQYLADVKRVLSVPAKAFYPEPAVDSAVVTMAPRRQGPFARRDEVFFWMTHGIYSYPNKQVRRALGIWCRNIGKSKELADEIIGRTGGAVESHERLRGLTQDQLVTLADTVLEFIEEGSLPKPDGNSLGIG